MLSLDPIKLLIIGVVALVVLGPDKLPTAARKISSLLGDLQKLRTSLQSEVHAAVGDLPLVDQLTGARQTLNRVKETADPRQALYRSIGLGNTASGSTTEQSAVPGAIDLSAADLQTDDVHRGNLVVGDPSCN